MPSAAVADDDDATIKVIKKERSEFDSTRWSPRLAMQCIAIHSHVDEFISMSLHHQLHFICIVNERGSRADHPESLELWCFYGQCVFCAYSSSEWRQHSSERASYHNIVVSQPLSHSLSDENYKFSHTSASCGDRERAHINRRIRKCKNGFSSMWTAACQHYLSG